MHPVFLATAGVLLLLSSAPAAEPASHAPVLEPDTIGLIGTARATGARGFVRITSTPAPFVMSVAANGDPRLDLEFVVNGLLDPTPLGGDTYVAWVASPQLDVYERIGPLESHARARGSTTLPKWLAIVTVENGPGGEKPSGPIVAHGLSPSGRLQSFQGHELFNGPKIGDAGQTPLPRTIESWQIVNDQPLTIRYHLAGGGTVTRTATW